MLEKTGLTGEQKTDGAGKRSAVDWKGIFWTIVILAICAGIITKANYPERAKTDKEESYRQTALKETAEITKQFGNNPATWMQAFGQMLPVIDRQIAFYNKEKLSDIEKSKIRERILINQQALLIMQDSIKIQTKRNIDKNMEKK